VIPDLRIILLRDLETLAREVALYPDDAGLWREVPGLPNAGGNLALHLCGNLRHFIGAVLGGTGYQRDRPAEFAARGPTREAVVAEIRTAAREVDDTLAALEPSRLSDPFPLAFEGRHLRTDLFLAHLCSHLAFHLGQLDYHRRVATGNPQGAGALSLAALAPDA
jgi:uncharacterized damage-inducible protein DinB